MPNRLSLETSPYLLQHAHNPVDWYPWGEEAFRAARDRDCPILLSIGYSACHWCHVMERESFENEGIAGAMNRHFVNVKVDREERPDVDQLYQGAVQLMGRNGGWPLTVFLTPALKPFYAGTYFPPEDRYGLPGFPRLIGSVAEAWRDRRTDLERSADEFESGLHGLMRAGLDGGAASEEPRAEDLVRSAERLAGAIDRESGGFEGAPKFPHPLDLSAMLRAVRRGARPDVLSGVLLTLDRMAAGGIYDQLGGGFHRYSVDGEWAVPHFEKMLYDNALLLRLYTEAWQLTGRSAYAEVVAETIGWMEREMRSPEGGFYSSQDADSEGEEGRFFVWSPRDLEEAVGPEGAALLAMHFGVDAQGNFEHGKTVLSLAMPAEQMAERLRLPIGEVARELGEAEYALLQARNRRPRPARDEKILAGWNGLAIAGLARAARAFGRGDWLALARGAAAFPAQTMLGPSGLMRTARGGRARIPGQLEDYGDLAWGMCELYFASLEPMYLELAQRFADAALERFWDPQARAFLASPRGTADLLAPVWALHDNAWPSGASTLTEALVWLAGLTAREHYLQVAASYLGRMREELVAAPMMFGQLWCAADTYLDGAATLLVAGERAESERLLAEVGRRFAPSLAVAWRGAHVPEALRALAEEKAPLDGKATSYLCRQFSCERPVAGLPELGGLALQPGGESAAPDREDAAPDPTFL